MYLWKSDDWDEEDQKLRRKDRFIADLMMPEGFSSLDGPYQAACPRCPVAMTEDDDRGDWVRFSRIIVPVPAA